MVNILAQQIAAVGEIMFLGSFYLVQNQSQGSSLVFVNYKGGCHSAQCNLCTRLQLLLLPLTNKSGLRHKHASKIYVE